LFVLDWLTKHWIVTRFQDPEAAYNPELLHRIEVIPGFFNLVRVHNRGMAWGLGDGLAWANVLFVGIAIVAMTFLTILWFKNAFPTRWSRLAVTLLVAGVFGNVFDRLYRGYVVDFLDFNFGKFGHFPSFNVADSCICIAAGLLIITAILGDPEEKSEAKPDSDAKDS
ncbi:MAG: signal peptidase II, partial [Verrucomicrobiales bacterium]